MKGFICLLFLTCNLVYCQIPLSVFRGKVIDQVTREVLVNAHILTYENGRVGGTVTNTEGSFTLSFSAHYDSVKVSYIGYQSKRISVYPTEEWVSVELAPSSVELSGIVIKPESARGIMTETISRIPLNFTSIPIQGNTFYREIIKNGESYFSIAEALFLTQYNPAQKDFKMKLLTGRSKEDINQTRLFEDFHPGGGPFSIAELDLGMTQPTFLDKDFINEYDFEIDSIMAQDDDMIYKISFDQKKEVKKALEMGIIYITGKEKSILRYEAEASPFGIPYIKNLEGSDKVFARLLHVDLERKGWKRSVDFKKVSGRWCLHSAFIENRIQYRQPSKQLDLDLTISVEGLFSNTGPLTAEITKDEAWRKNQLIINLPTAFNDAFWGSYPTLSPDRHILNVIDSIKINQREFVNTAIEGWRRFRPELFVADKSSDGISMIPLMKSHWSDDEVGAMLYQEKLGDFEMKVQLNLRKGSNRDKIPDTGFQQAGIIIRQKGPTENYFLCTLGTGGNSNLKVFLNTTEKGSSKTKTEKIESASLMIRVTKTKDLLEFDIKEKERDSWKRVGRASASWLQDEIQLGLACFAHFPGNAPKMKPDMIATFGSIEIRDTHR